MINVSQHAWVTMMMFNPLCALYVCSTLYTDSFYAFLCGRLDFPQRFYIDSYSCPAVKKCVRVHPITNEWGLFRVIDLSVSCYMPVAYKDLDWIL